MVVHNLIIFVVMLLTSTVAAAAAAEDELVAFKVPDECKGKRFCPVKPEGYEKLENKINSLLPEFLLNDYADRYGPEDLTPKRSPEEDWHNCPYVTKLEQMYLYYHGENNTKTEIIVQTKLFKQYIETVSCEYTLIDTDSDVQCFQDLGVGKFNTKSTCVTSNANRTLYVFDIDRAKIIQKYFEVPACCSCQVLNRT